MLKNIDTHAAHTGYVVSCSPKYKASTSMCAGLSFGLGIMIAGGVQATNTQYVPYINLKDKSPIHLIVGSAKSKGANKAGDAASNPPSWVQDINWIKGNADVTVSRLAEAFGVTRKAFYGWMEGAEPRKGGSLYRISILREILESLPAPAYRSVFFGLIDEISGDGASFREVFLSPVDEPGYRDRLNGKLAEMASSLESAVRRANRSVGNSRFFESDYPAA